MSIQVMSEAQTRFAERLSEEVEAVLGPSGAIDTVTISGDGPVTIVTACRIDDRIHEMAGEGATLLEASRALITAAAELRLSAAWHRLMVTA